MVQLNDRFFISAIPTCYVLQEKTTIKDEDSKNFGSEVTNNLGYYSTIADAIKGVQKKLLREYLGKEEKNTLKDLLAEIKKTNDLIEEFKL